MYVGSSRRRNAWSVNIFCALQCIAAALILYCIVFLALRQDDDSVQQIQVQPDEPQTPPAAEEPLRTRFTSHGPQKAQDVMCITVNDFSKSMVQEFKDTILNKRARTIIDIGSATGHYAFFAASAGIYVFSFERDNGGVAPRRLPQKQDMVHLNELHNVPQYVDLMVIHRWETYEDIIEHCLRYSTIPRIFIIQQRQQCDTYSLQHYMKHYSDGKPNRYRCHNLLDMVLCELTTV